MAKRLLAKLFLRPALLCAALLFLAPRAGVAGAAVGVKSIDVDGTNFVVSLSDGQVLRSRDLVGATLNIVTGGGGALRLRIDAVEADPGDAARSSAASSEVLLHSFSFQTPEGEWRNLCEPGPDGRRQGFPIAGRAAKDATIAPAEAGVFELTCTGGAQGKCVRFGYRPWEKQPDGASTWSLYNACVRLVRADYSGDGKGTTRNGQPIDIYDFLGVQKKADDPSHDFEAGWSPQGAVCVRHVRVKENTSLAALEDSAPRLKGRTGAICTEEFARANGALLFNRSPP
jgi:hypothetical protein